MPRKYKPPLHDLTVKAEDCYDPRDYVLVHKDYLAHLQALALPLKAETPASAGQGDSVMTVKTEKTAHTPGPWGYEASADYFEIAPVADAGLDWSREIAATAGPVGDEQEANARLIAAAPDLLNALKLIESVYRQNCVAVGEPSSVLDAVQAAIAKAEGEP